MTPSEPQGGPLRSLYQELILDHFRRPRNRGEATDAHLSIRRNNPTCGDEIELHLRLADGRIQDLRFGGQGCSISQASASMMTEVLRGATPAEARALTDRFREMLRGDEQAAKDRSLKDLRALAGVANYPARVRCAMLAWAALAELIPASSEGGGGEVSEV